MISARPCRATASKRRTRSAECEEPEEDAADEDALRDDGGPPSTTILDLHLRVGVGDDLREHRVQPREEGGARLGQAAGLRELDRRGSAGVERGGRAFQAFGGGASHVEIVEAGDRGREGTAGLEPLTCFRVRGARASAAARCSLGRDRPQLLARGLCAAQLDLRLAARVGHAARPLGDTDGRAHDQQDQSKGQGAGVLGVRLRGCRGQRLHVRGIGELHRFLDRRARKPLGARRTDERYQGGDRPDGLSSNHRNSDTDGRSRGIFGVRCRPSSPRWPPRPHPTRSRFSAHDHHSRAARRSPALGRVHHHRGLAGLRRR